MTVRVFVLQVINFDSPRGGISLVTEKGPVTSSRLLIQKAGPADDGDYTCDPASANPATVRVHILNGMPLPVQFRFEHRGSPAGMAVSTVSALVLQASILRPCTTARGVRCCPGSWSACWRPTSP